MIELENVSFTYGNGDRSCGLSGINLAVKKGEFVLLCGCSGCGKTTLTRLINGLIPNYYEGNLIGQVLVNGMDVSKVPLYETAEIVGSVFQNPRSQFFNVDTTSELSFGCENMGLPPEEIHKRVNQTSRELGLGPLLGRSIFALSGGEKQKIACGSAAALEPLVYVLDEPSSNLDLFAVEELRILLSRWKQQGKTVVIAEHRLHYLCELIDRVIYMEDGHISREYSGREFSALNGKNLDRMGLRTLSLESLFERAFLQAKNRSGVISLFNFCFAYPRCAEVLHVERASVPQGEVIAVIGPNGAGKSTFSRCLCALEKRNCGVAELDGRSLTEKHRIKICYMVMQDVNHQLFTESVLDEVLISMEKEDPEQAKEILRRLDLLQFKDCHPMSLSGGQKQRVAIASAIASERRILVFDEPTSGLDFRHMREVAQNLRQLADMGKSVFVVTHDPELILSCCTHVIQFEAGKIIRNEPLDLQGMEQTLTYFLKVAGENAEYKEKVG